MRLTKLLICDVIFFPVIMFIEFFMTLSTAVKDVILLVLHSAATEKVEHSFKG